MNQRVVNVHHWHYNLITYLPFLGLSRNLSNTIFLMDAGWLASRCWKKNAEIEYNQWCWYLGKHHYVNQVYSITYEYRQSFISTGFENSYIRLITCYFGRVLCFGIWTEAKCSFYKRTPLTNVPLGCIIISTGLYGI